MLHACLCHWIGAPGPAVVQWQLSGPSALLWKGPRDCGSQDLAMDGQWPSASAPQALTDDGQDPFAISRGTRTGQGRAIGWVSLLPAARCPLSHLILSSSCANRSSLGAVQTVHISASRGVYAEGDGDGMVTASDPVLTSTVFKPTTPPSAFAHILKAGEKARCSLLWN